MRRRVVEQPEVVPDRLRWFRSADWADPADSIEEFLDPAWFRAFHRWLDAKRAHREAR